MFSRIYRCFHWCSHWNPILYSVGHQDRWQLRRCCTPGSPLRLAPVWPAAACGGAATGTAAAAGAADAAADAGGRGDRMGRDSEKHGNGWGWDKHIFFVNGMSGQVSPHLPGSLDYNKTSRQLLPSFFLPCSFLLPSVSRASLPASLRQSLIGALPDPNNIANSTAVWGSPDQNAMSDKMPDRMSECMPGRLWEYMGDKSAYNVCQIRCQERLAELEFMSERIVGIYVKYSTHFWVSYGCLFIYLFISQNRKLNPLDHRITDNYKPDEMVETGRNGHFLGRLWD